MIVLANKQDKSLHSYLMRMNMNMNKMNNTILLLQNLMLQNKDYKNESKLVIIQK